MSRPIIGSKVRVQLGAYEDCPWINATVLEHLSAQFTAITETGRIVYGLYRSAGGAWKQGW